ncbi:MAG: winged helix-turn-helix domain-containing protein [Sphingomicrobium sp.]
MEQFIDESGLSRVDLGRAHEFALGHLLVRPADLLIESGQERHELQPRVMQVLVALAEGKSKVVSRDQLIERCWDGVIVGDDSINRCILTLRNLAKSLAPSPFVIETVPRIGYRLVEQGELPPRQLATAEAESNSKVKSKSKSKFSMIILGSVLVIGLASIIMWLFYPLSPVPPSTIAVTPFRTLSTGNPYFAEGLSEEILDQLSHDPDFRLAGRSSAARMGTATDLRRTGRELGIDYVLEGSVRTEQGRVRVDAALVHTSDGVLLWSQSYDRQLGDTFAIQQAIGQSVAAALDHKFAAQSPAGPPVAINGDAYRDFLTASGMLRTRNPKLGSTAAELLRGTVASAPNFAPGWSRLAEAIRLSSALDGPDAIIARLPEAIADARRAVALSPNLAEAHGTLGVLLGYESAEAQGELRRGAQLAPHDAEAVLWLASADAVRGDFEQEIADYRRAQALDPQWFRPSRDLMVATAEMGDRVGADAIADRADPSDSISQNMFHARIAWLFGDMAQAAKRWTAVATIDSLWRDPARIALSNARFTLSMPGAGPPLTRAHTAELRGNLGRIWLAKPPSQIVWARQNRSALAATVYAEDNIVAAKMILNAGRGKELLWGYDQPIGLLSVHRDRPLNAWELRTVPLVALALRQGGRPAEADTLLRQADALATLIQSRGRIPFTFAVTAAAVKAVSGDGSQALALLEGAERRGWSHSDVVDLVRLQDEPAFVPIHGQPRFTALVERLDHQLIARERQRALRLNL